MSNTLSAIGNTRLISLSSIVPEDCARISIKLESDNPTGSMKDRMALAMIEAAESDGRLEPGDRVIEYTAGSTGVSLAFVCALKGYPLRIITSDAFSQEKRRHMNAYGAELTVIRSDNGAMDAGLTRRMIDAARATQAEQGGFLVNQLANADQIPAYQRLGEEILAQTHGSVDAFVQSTGSTASCQGVSKALHAHNKNIHCVAVEPSESAVLSGGETGSHGMEGVGAGFVVPLWQPDSVDEVMTVSTIDAMAMSRKLAREEGLLAGTSTGANLVAAILLGRRLGPDATIVTLMCDSGMKYLSTELYGQR